MTEGTAHRRRRLGRSRATARTWAVPGRARQHLQRHVATSG